MRGSLSRQSHLLCSQTLHFRKHSAARIMPCGNSSSVSVEQHLNKAEGNHSGEKHQIWLRKGDSQTRWQLRGTEPDQDP